MNMELLRLSIASELCGIEKMVGPDYHLSLIARHENNPNAHICVTSEKQTGNAIRCLLELDKNSTDDVHKHALFMFAVGVAERTAEHIIDNIHFMQAYGFEGTLADARDHLRDLYDKTTLAAIVVGNPEPTCEHGVADGTYCKPCRDAYKEAERDEAEAVLGKPTMYVGICRRCKKTLPVADLEYRDAWEQICKPCLAIVEAAKQ